MCSSPCTELVGKVSSRVVGVESGVKRIVVGSGDDGWCEECAMGG